MMASAAPSSNPSASEFAHYIASLYSKEEIAQAIKQVQFQPDMMTRYRDDPAGFGIELLGEYYTPDMVRVAESVRDYRVTIARSANAVGKSQPVGTPVLTPVGYRPIGDLQVGDLVFARDGSPTEVIRVYPQGLQDTYIVTFNDGSSVKASADHLWVAQSSGDKSRRKQFGYFWTTEALARTLNRFMAIPICEPVQFPEKKLQVDPYVMGILLGDGTLTGSSLRFDTADEWILQKVTSLVKEQFGDAIGVSLRGDSGTHYGICGAKGCHNPALSAVREYGLMGHRAESKFIPSDYMTGSVSQRKALLAGLLDSDGCAGRRGTVTFTSTSLQMTHQVVELVNTLGGTATIKSRRTHYHYNGELRTGRRSYRLYIKLPFCPFWLPRKAVRWRNPNKKGGSKNKPISRIVRSVEYVGKEESVCIKVAHPEMLYLTDHCIVTHNTFLAGRLSLWFLLSWEDSQVYTTSAPPEDNLKRLLWGEIGATVRKHPELIDGFKVRTLHIERHPLSFLAGVAIPVTGTAEERESKFAGKHSPHLLFIVDEGDAVPEEVYKGIESCMSDSDARLLIMLNPRRRAGRVWRMERDGKANIIELSAFSHPNVLYGENRIPGAVSRGITVKRINEWTRPLTSEETPSEKCFKVPAFLVGTVAVNDRSQEYPPLPAGYREVIEPAFWYMVLGKYPQQDESQLISQDWINNARARWDAYVAVNGMIPPQNVPPVMGLDVGEYGPDPNVACFRYGGWVAPFIVWNDMDTDAVADRGLELYQQHGCTKAFVDATGYGSNVAPKMSRNRATAVSVKVAESPTTKPTDMDAEFLQLRDQLWWMCREWLKNDPGAMLPPDEMLIEELLAPTYTYHGTKRKLKVMGKDAMRDILKRSPDRADSLCLTFAPTGGWSVGSTSLRR